MKNRWCIRKKEFYQLTFQEYMIQQKLDHVSVKARRAYVGVMKQAMRNGIKLNDNVLRSMIELGYGQFVQKHLNKQEKSAFHISKKKSLGGRPNDKAIGTFERQKRNQNLIF